jgi:hypothetical protein
MERLFPLGDKELSIGILGMTEGNAHPFSWSAMYNNYNREAMQKYTGELYPTIPAYLGKQPAETLSIPNAHITHICFTGYADREEAEHCAEASLIPHVVDRPEDMIGKVDAVICATDIGSEHVERCRPFLEQGIPMFIDKPLVDSEEDLKQFVKWHDEGAHFISSSSMRYNKAMEPFYENHYEFGKLRYICSTMPKKWETYGIHALEGMFNLLGRGFVSVQNTGTYESPMVHLYHESGCYVDIPMGIGMKDMGIMILGEAASTVVTTGDSFYCFKKQMDNFVRYLRTGIEPQPFDDTVEMMKIIIAGIRSREEGGRKVLLSEIQER